MQTDTTRLLSVALLALAAGTSSAYAAEWPAKIWNPKPSPDDVVLSLPCGGKLALRRVHTGATPPDSPEAPLADSPILVGATAGNRSYIEYRRQDHIAGSLNEAGGQESYFLIGKYELSEAQHKAIMAERPEDCPSRLSPPDAVPAAHLSWYDAVDITRRINKWIYGGDRVAQLAALGIEDGYVRLPTEIEWEFATRGGVVLPEAERGNSRFFASGTIDEYAWYNGTQSSGGKIKPIGQKQPNALELYDLYGNAEEITLDPFRLTRLDRPHGRVGGFVVRGGSFLDGPETLTSSRRDEIPFFSAEAQGEMRRRTTGMRVLVSTAAIGDLASVERLEAAAQALAVQVQAPAAEQPTERLEEIEARVEGPLRAEIAELRSQLAAEFARRNEIDARSLRRAIFNASLAGRELLLAAKAIDNHIANIEDPAFEEAWRERTRRNLERDMNQFRMFATVYTDAVAQIATDQGNDVAAQSDILSRELERQNRGGLTGNVERATQQIEAYRAGRQTDTRDILRTLIGDRRWLADL